MELLARRDAVACSARGQAGKGASGGGVTASPEDEERGLSDPLRGEAPSRPSAHRPRQDKNRRTPCPVLGVGRRGGLAGPCEKKMPPPAPPLTLSHTPHPPQPSPAAPSHPGTQCEMAADAHARRGSGHGTQDSEKTPAFLWKVRTCPRLLPTPRGTALGGERPAGAGRGRGRAGGQRVRSTSRHTQPACPRSTGRGGSSPRV